MKVPEKEERETEGEHGISSASAPFQEGSVPQPPEKTRPVFYLMTQKGYLHPMKTYVWITLLIIGVMTILWFIMGIGPGAQGTIPPALAFGASDLYFHSIAIALAALAVYLVIMAYDLDKYEPNIDFPIAYRALTATVLGVIGAFFYLRPVFNAALAPIPLGFIFLGFLLLGDVGGALLIQLYLLPAKRAGTYDPSLNFMGMIPRWKCLPSWKDFRRMDATFWLTFVTVISTFIAGLIGFVALWVNYFIIDIGVSPGIFKGYVAWMGGAPALLAYTIGSHSHIIGMTLVLGVVAVTAKQFGAMDLTGLKAKVAKLGLWVSGIGIVVMTATFLLEAFTTVWPNSTPPLLFASNPSGLTFMSSLDANGMAGDDSTMFLASAGAMIMFVPLMFTRVRGGPAWRDPLRVSVLATWLLAYIATPLEGFYIEFHEATMHLGPTDIVYGNQQFFAFFGITMVTMAFLTVDRFQDRKVLQSTTAAMGMGALLFTLVAGYIYAYLDPGVLNAQGSLAGTTPWSWVYSAGLILVALSVMASMVVVYVGRDEKIVSPATETDEFRTPAMKNGQYGAATPTMK